MDIVPEKLPCVKYYITKSKAEGQIVTTGGVGTTMLPDTHVLNRSGLGVKSPADRL